MILAPWKDTCVYRNREMSSKTQWGFNLTHLSLWQPFEACHLICLPRQYPGLCAPARRRHVNQQVWSQFAPVKTETPNRCEELL